MIDKILVAWINVSYRAMMLGNKNKKVLNWKNNLKYLFNFYYFYLLSSIFASFIIVFLPKNLSLIISFISVIIIAIYVYSISGLFEKIISRTNYEPYSSYKKDIYYDIISFIFTLLFAISFFYVFIISFRLWYYVKIFINSLMNYF